MGTEPLRSKRSEYDFHWAPSRSHARNQSLFAWPVGLLTSNFPADIRKIYVREPSAPSVRTVRNAVSGRRDTKSVTPERVGNHVATVRQPWRTPLCAAWCAAGHAGVLHA